MSCKCRLFEAFGKGAALPFEPAKALSQRMSKPVVSMLPGTGS